jgi:hypothetical protein
MGFLRDAKTSAVGAEAVKAYENGDWYFTPVLNSPATRLNISGNVQDWADMLKAITEAGWNLQYWNVGSDAKGRPEAYPLFVRRQ